MNLREVMEKQEKLQDDMINLNCALKHCGNWGPTDKSFDDFIIRLIDSKSISVKVLLSTRDELLAIQEWDLQMCHIIVETGEKVKLADCIERLAKLEEDCSDLKEALLRIGNWSPSCVETTEEFLAQMRESKRCSVELLISSLVLLEEEMRIWLESEVHSCALAPADSCALEGGDRVGYE